MKAMLIPNTTQLAYFRPCDFCGLSPKVGDIWRVDDERGVHTEGHKECFDTRETA